MFALEPGNGQFVFAGLPGPVRSGNGGGPIGGTPAYLGDDHLTLFGIRNSYQYHPVMEQGGVKTDNGGLLPPHVGYRWR